MSRTVPALKSISTTVNPAIKDKTEGVVKDHKLPNSAAALQEVMIGNGSR